MEPRVSVIALRCGTLTAPGAVFVAGWDGDVELQVWAFAVVHPAGTVLYDTGMHPSVRGGADAHPAAGIGGMHIDYGDGDDIATRLARAGIDPGDVRRVVCSHLHFDHAGGCALLPSARLVVQEREWSEAHAGDAIGYVRTDFDTGQDVELVDGPHDVFGDGLVRCVPTPGHTAGHQSLLVHTGGRRVLFTADACYLRASLEQRALPAFGWDLAEQRRVLEHLAREAATGTVLVFGHDPALTPAAAALLTT